MLLSIIACLGACSPKHASYTDFRDISSDGWQEGAPFKFTPMWGDSSATYDFTIVVRHSASYNYNNLCLVIDFISTDGKVVRKDISFAIADEYGNFKGGGFGDYYQVKHKVMEGIKPEEAAKIVVWPAMKGCKKLTGLLNIGIILSPVKK